MPKFQSLTRMIPFWYSANVSIYIVLVEEIGDKQKKNKTTIYLSSYLVLHLKLYTFNIILYGHKIKKKIISIHIDLYCSMPRGAKCWHDVIFIDMIDTTT